MTAALMGIIAIACGDTRVQPDPYPDPVPDARPGAVNAPPAGATIVEVILSEWLLTPDEATVQSGPVYFLAKNVGARAHELVVIRTGLPADELPDVNGRVPEDEVDLTGEIRPFLPRSNASMVLDLPPGKYALICNIVERRNEEIESHYLEGMYADFTVE